MTPGQRNIWNRGLTDVRVRGTLEHGSAILAMDTHVTGLEDALAVIRAKIYECPYDAAQKAVADEVAAIIDRAMG